MSAHPFLPPYVSAYVTETATRESDVQRRLRMETTQLGNGGMQTTADQAAFLTFLVKLTGARRVIEIGTFTGYGSLALALALPEDGRLICCDVNRDWPALGEKYWQEAGVAEKIDLRIGRAQDTLSELLKTQQMFDLIFVDADKQGYDAYYELGLQLLRAGGVMVFDNMLWHGDVANPDNNDKQTIALRALNEKIINDSRVDASFLTVGDGMMLARRRAA